MGSVTPVSTNKRLSPRTFAGYSLLVALSFFIAGVAGLLTSVVMVLMGRLTFALDSHEKHGISHQESSRLGGVAIALCALIFYWTSAYLEMFYMEIARVPRNNWVILCALVIGSVGLWGDLFEELSPSKRLGLTAVVLAVFLGLFPQTLPSSIGVLGIDLVLRWPVISFFLSLVACLGLINAANMADGANGLMSGVFLGVFYCYFTITFDALYLGIAAALAVFMLFNIFSGRLFLGDSGAYALGCLASLGALSIVNQIDISIWVFLCLAAYPIIDFFASALRRMASGKSALAPDNGHLHNKLYAFVSKFTSSPLCANSLSGLLISASTAGVSVVCMYLWPLDSINWGWLFLLQVVTYYLVFLILSRFTEEAK